MANNAQEPSILDDIYYLIPEDEYARLLRLQAVAGILECLESPRHDGIVMLDQVAYFGQLIVYELAEIISKSIFFDPTGLAAPLSQTGSC